MTDVSPTKQRARLLEGLAYLRRHALEAHHAGDGFNVLHHSAVALRRCAIFGNKNPDFRVPLFEIRWAFILGMYWVVNDWFLYVVNSSLNHIDCEGENSTDNQLIVHIHNIIYRPNDSVDIDNIDEIPLEWWDERGGQERTPCEEDHIALIFLIELIWYTNPESNRWSMLINKWLKCCNETNTLKQSLEKLKKRLDFQTGFYTGEAFQKHENLQLPIDDDIQQYLFQGWIAYYNCDWDALRDSLKLLQNRVRVESNEFRPLFSLMHISRVHREDAEDQFVSLSRLQIARSRQPAQSFQQFRESYADSQFLLIATDGFPKNAHGNERLAVMRLVMLASLQALRTWDVGSWLSSMKQRAKSRLELGMHDDLQFALTGVLDSVLAHAVPNPKKSPHFSHCLQLIDKLDVDSRRDFVRKLLKLPPIEWQNIYKILCVLSDSIPEDVLPELADWSLKVEQSGLLADLLENRSTHTLMDVWNEILSRVSNKTKLVEQLASVLRKTIIVPSFWDKLHDRFLAAICNGPIQLANELVDLLVSTDCTSSHWNPHRFSIAYNVLENRPDVGRAC